MSEGVVGCGHLQIYETISEPAASTDIVSFFVDTDVKVKFSDGTVKIITRKSASVLESNEIALNSVLKGSATNPYFILGSDSSMATGLTATDSTTRHLGGHRLAIEVVSLTGSGTVVIAGTYITNGTGVPTTGTRTIVVDTASQFYSTTERFITITSITIPAGIIAINYNIASLCGYNKGLVDMKVTGFRLLMSQGTGGSQSAQFRAWVIRDNGSNKITKIPIEDITVSTTAITDTLRSTRDVSGTFFSGLPHVPLAGTGTVHMDFTDYLTYFTSGETEVRSSTKELEGLIVRLDWTNLDLFETILRTTRI